MLITRQFKALFLLFAVLGIYYPAIFSGFNLVDDPEFFGRLESTGTIDIASLFKWTGGEYYRPLTYLTFYLDKIFWALDPGFMHLENVLLHAVNALLVFVIAEKIFRREQIDGPELPLIAGLLFALHPVNTETVNWIVCRYDLLATSFVLTSLLCLYYGVEKDRQRYFFLSAGLLLLGTFAKENALFVFPVAIVLSVSLSSKRPYEVLARWRSIARMWRSAVPYSIGVFAYFIIRKAALFSHETGLGRVKDNIVHAVSYDFIELAKVSITLLGFYVKKMIVPVPLNMAIAEVNALYIWFGIFLLFLLFFLAVRRTYYGDQFLISIFVLSPTIILLLSKVGWTPVAERYLYLSTAFFSIAVAGAGHALSAKYKKEKWMLAVALPVLMAAALVTVQRTLLWQDNVALFQDTISKSPRLLKLQNSLADALKAAGRTEEAEILLERAAKENPQHVFLLINQADLLLKKGKLDEARIVVLKTFTEKGSAKVESLVMLAMIDEKRMGKAQTIPARNKIALDLLDTYKYIYGKNKNAINLYRSGQLSLLLGRTADAAGYFQQAYDLSPEDAFFKEAARKLADKFRTGAGEKKERGTPEPAERSVM